MTFVRRIRFTCASFFCYLVLFISLFPEVVFSGATFAKRDIWRFYFPSWKFAVQSAQNGVLPLWNPYNSYGTPFLANIQTCFFYPLTLIFYLPDFRWAFNFYILLHLAMAGAFCALWMKECRASNAAAFLSGLAYCLGGYVMSSISLTISLATLTYFPLALLTFRRAFTSGRFFWKAIASIVLLVQYLAGDPAVFFATLVVLTMATLCKTFASSWRRRKLDFKYVIDFLTITTIFLGLSLFHTLLFFEFLMHSHRIGLGYNQVTAWSLQYNDILSLVFPYFSDLSIPFMDYWVRQSWMENSYAGIITLMLATTAFWGLKTNNQIRYHLALVLFGIALSLGRFSPVYDAFYHGFPFFRFIRYPVRFLFLTSFALACLAGFGFDGMLSRAKQSVPSLTKTKACLVAALILLLTALVLYSMVYSEKILSYLTDAARGFLTRWAGHDFGYDTVMDFMNSMLVNMKRTTVLACLFLIGLLAALHYRLRQSLLTVFFILLVFADLVGTNVIEASISGSAIQKPGKNLERLLEDDGIFRVIASPSSVQLQYQPPGAETLELTMMQLMETLTPNLLLPYHIGDVSSYDSIHLRESIAVNSERRNIPDATKRRFYDMLNVKYLVSPNEAIDGNYRLVQKAYPVNLFLNEKALPRAFLVREAEVVGDRESILKKITAADYEPEKTVFLEEEKIDTGDGGTSSRGLFSGNERVDITSYSLNQVEMQVDSSGPQWLFFSDMFYPGWRATLDGKPLRIHRANYAFRAVRVPEGRFSLKWNYDPILFKIGVIVSLLTALGLAVGLWRGRRRYAL